MIAVCLMALVFRGWLDTDIVMVTAAVEDMTMEQLDWWGRSQAWLTLSTRR